MQNTPASLEAEIQRLAQENATLRRELEAGRSEAIFDAAFDQAPHFAGLLALDGALLQANRSACAFIGRRAAEVVGQPFWSTPWWAHAPEEQEKLRGAIVKAAQGASVRFETTSQAADGSLHPVDFTLRPAWDKEGRAFALIVEGWDITERKAALVQLRTLAHEQRVILDTLTAGLCRIKKRRHQWCNPAFAKMFGYTTDEVQGSDTAQYYSHPTDYERVGREGYAQLAQDLGYTTEARMRRKDGSDFWCRLTGRAIDPQQQDSIWLLEDITERHEAAEALRLSQSRLEAAQAHAHIGSWEFDPVSGMRYWSKEMFHLWNLAPDAGQPSLDAYVGLAHPEDREPLAHALQTGEPPVVDHRSDPAHGPVRFFTTTLQTVKDATGRVRQISGTVQDITERHEAESALRNSERKLSEIFHASPEMIVVSRLTDGRLIELNDAFTRVLGYSLDEALYHTSMEIGLWPSPEAREQVVRQVIEQGGVRNRETQFCRKSGELVSVLLAAVPITINSEKCLLWLLTDITEHKRTEAAMREGEKRFQRLVQNSNDIIVVLDATGGYTSLSGPLETILGYTPEELLGHNGFALLHPDDVPAAQQALAEAIATPGTVHRIEYRHRHKDGHWIAMEAVGTSWLHDPVIRGLVLNIREITERKNAERERTKLQEQLQQAMKMEAVGRLAGGVAHDFNNLLTVISGNVELARADLDAADPLAQYLAEVAKAAGSAASLTRQLLAFSRRQIIEPKTLNLNDLIGNLRKMLHRLIGEDIALQVTLATDLGSVKVDPGQFEQVVINLSVNARDAMPDGGRLILETANADLDEAYTQGHPDVKPGDYVMLSVSDNGQGMTAEVKRRLFEPFYTTKPKGRGTGLGLAMIFGAVKQAGGTIEVYSEVGQGTTFKIYLPRIAGPAEKLARPAASADLPRGDETILLVEDDSSVRDLAAAILKRQGYRVLLAANGGEAFLLAEKHPEPIHLLLTDVVMPGMNGRELAERLRLIHPEIAVLFTSGYTEDMIVRHGVMDEQLHFIGKPYTLQAIARKTRQVLDAGAHDQPSATEP